MELEDPFPRPFRMLLRPGKGSRRKHEPWSEPNEGDQQSTSLTSDTVIPNVPHTRGEQADRPIAHQHRPTTRSEDINERIEHQIDQILPPGLESQQDTTKDWTEAFPHTDPLSIPAIFINAPENPRYESTASQPLLNATKNASVSVLDLPNNTTYSHDTQTSHWTLHTAQPARPHDKPSSRPARSHRIRKQTHEKPRIFPCTFCYDTFKSKHDWVRHELSLHLDLETWTCAPDDGILISPSTGQPHCIYCDYPDPAPDHLEEHKHNACAGTDRAFSRKDHLMQHLRLVHHVKQVPAIETWKKDAPPFVCRCGFCDRQLNSWKERMDHLAVHFRKGFTMHDWQGDHGFSPSVAAQVRNAIPPHLIGEGIRMSPCIPGGDFHVPDHEMDLYQNDLADASQTSNPETTGLPHNHMQQNNVFQEIKAFSDLLALHLSGFARENIQRGIFPTDEMFQKESKRLMDSWNQTMAEDTEPLGTFQQAQNESG